MSTMTIYFCQSSDRNVEVKYKIDDQEIKKDCWLLANANMAAKKFIEEFPQIKKFVIMDEPSNGFHCNHRFYRSSGISYYEVQSYSGIRYFYDNI